MLSIGELARLGQVSVRMLRHYDGTGLLTPARVDERNGHRWYVPQQLARLNRLVALKELGFSLEEVGVILDHDLPVDQLRGMLRLRRSQLTAERTAISDRLSLVDHRLRVIEQEERMSQTEYVVKPLPAMRLAARQATVPDLSQESGGVEQMFIEAAEAISAVGGSRVTPVAVYEQLNNALRIVTGFAHDGSPVPTLDVVDLPAVPKALCGVHLGTMDTVVASWQALHQAIEDQRLAPDGPARELYVRAEPAHDESDWVVELQQPVRAL